MPNSFQASVSALKKIAPLLWLRFSLGYAELSGTHSSGLLHLYIALQASMQVATFEDIVLAIPRSFPIKALYFLFVAVSLRLLPEAPAQIVPPPCSCWFPRLGCE
jgi:TRAP-type C4-dicarboxylate transport system permease small subunit